MVNNKAITSEMIDACNRYMIERKVNFSIIEYCWNNKHYTWETILDDEDNVIDEERVITVDCLEDACEELRIPFALVKESTNYENY